MPDNYQLPYNLEEEQIVLGIMLIDEVSMIEGLSDINETDFYEGYEAHAIIFNAIGRLYRKGLKVCDEISFLTEELRLSNELDVIGGVDYITHLLDKVTTVVNLQDHINIIKDNKTLRDLLKLLRSTEQKYTSHGAGNITDFLDEFNYKSREISEKRRISKFITTGELVNRFREEMPAKKSTDPSSNIAYNGVTTGYRDLDNSVNGFKRGEYIIIAGRPSMGKTAVALNIALESAKKTKRTVGFFSLEMPGELLLQRMLAAEGRISSNNLRTANIVGEDEAKLEAAYDTLQKAKIYVDDSTNNTVLEIVAKATKLKNSNPDLSMVFIDYLGFIVGDSKLKSEQEKVTEISKQLKNMAKTLDIPVVVLCQLNRGAEARSSNKPLLNDLRSSGSLEQDADIVILLYREGYYLLEKEKDGKKLSDKQESKKAYESKLKANGLSMMELIVAKNRTGKQYKNCFLLFNLEYSKFEEIAGEEKKLVWELYSSDDNGE